TGAHQSAALRPGDEPPRRRDTRGPGRPAQADTRSHGEHDRRGPLAERSARSTERSADERGAGRDADAGRQRAGAGRGARTGARALRPVAWLRPRHWRLQQAAGLDLVPSNDFSYYDRMLDTCTLVGAVPKRYGWVGGPVDLDTYFAMARGAQQGGRDVTAMEMTKWFDTNYHYIVPEFEPAQAFRLSSSKPVDEFQEAKALGIHTKPA